MHTEWTSKHASAGWFERDWMIDRYAAEEVLDYNRHYINDLPGTSRHGSYSDTMEKI